MQATLTFLGSGTSMGVPTLGCTCAVCTAAYIPGNPNRRTRPSIALSYNDHTVLIDTGPDFHAQAIRERIMAVDAVLYTHSHADHILGMDDLRPLSFRLSTDLGTSIDLFGATFQRIPVTHGRNTIAGYRFGSAAYLTDMSDIPPESVPLLQDLDILVLDALRREPHPSHSHLANSIALVEKIAPKRAFFTHISHDLDHETTNSELPGYIKLAHDGLKLAFDINPDQES